MRPPDKKRYLRALKHIESKEVSFQEDEFHPVIIGQILGRPVPPVRSYELPAADLIELNLKAGTDMIMLANLWECGRDHIVNGKGRKLYVGGLIKTRDDLKNITFPNLDDVRRRIEDVLDAAEGTGLGLKYRPNNSKFIVEMGNGYEDYYINLKTDPGFIHEFQDHVQDYCFAELELALSYPVDVIQLSLIFSSNMGPMVSPEITEEFEYPQLRQSIRIIREKDKDKPISLHVDGVIDNYIETFIELGFDIVHPLEPCNGKQDIYAIKKRFGDRIALHGNIDVGGVLVFGSPREVAQDVREHLDRLAVGGGYVCGSSHDISEAIPLINFYAMRDTVHQYRFQPDMKVAE